MKTNIVQEEKKTKRIKVNKKLHKGQKINVSTVNGNFVAEVLAEWKDIYKIQIID